MAPATSPLIKLTTPIIHDKCQNAATRPTKIKRQPIGRAQNMNLLKKSLTLLLSSLGSLRTKRHTPNIGSTRAKARTEMNEATSDSPAAINACRTLHCTNLQFRLIRHQVVPVPD